MKLKRLFVVPMIIVMALLVVLGTTSCDSILHEHSFSEWETVSLPTCTSFGLEKRECECGDVEYKTLEATAHTNVVDPSVDASCDATGKTEGVHCSTCGAIISKQDETAKIAHTYSDWETVSLPSCTSIGREKRECECGFTQYATIDALGHTEVADARIEATCDTAGKTEGSHCDVCGDVIVHQELIPPIGHKCDDVSVITEAAHGVEGTKRYSCTNEGCEYSYDETYDLPTLTAEEIFSEASQYTGVLSLYDTYGNPIRQCSAFVISADGKIVTSTYFLDNAFVGVFTLGENEYEVTDVLAYSNDTAYAVLEINATDLPYARICEGEIVNGEIVYSVGCPAGLTPSITEAIVSNANRISREIRFIQHDSMLSEGYFGGPLLNCYGEVIGINNMTLAQNEQLPVATHIGEMDKLDYSAPMTMLEYGELTYTPMEKVGNWVANFQNCYSPGVIGYRIQGSNYYYCIGYAESGSFVEVQGYWRFENQYDVYTSLIINNLSGTYEVVGSFTDGARLNEFSGFIDAATYSKDTVIEYDTYYGRYWNESEIMALYNESIYKTIVWFEYYLETYFFDLTIADFGFNNIADRDETALDKLTSFVVENGVLDGSTYNYTMMQYFGNDVMYYDISYFVGEGDAPDYTVLFIYYITERGEMYGVALVFTDDELGYEFNCFYRVHDGTQYVEENYAFGYIAPNEFTDITPLFAYEFNGMNEYEDALLADYASLLRHGLNMLNITLAEIDPALSIKDLGFYFYFE